MYCANIHRYGKQYAQEKINNDELNVIIVIMFFNLQEERFKIYAVYCKNFDQADTFLKKRIKRKLDFDSFLKVCRMASQT